MTQPAPPALPYWRRARLSAQRALRRAAACSTAPAPWSRRAMHAGRARRAAGRRPRRHARPLLPQQASTPAPAPPAWGRAAAPAAAAPSRPLRPNSAARLGPPARTAPALRASRAAAPVSGRANLRAGPPHATAGYRLRPARCWRRAGRRAAPPAPARTPPRSGQWHRAAAAAAQIRPLRGCTPRGTRASSRAGARAARPAPRGRQSPARSAPARPAAPGLRNRS